MRNNRMLWGGLAAVVLLAGLTVWRLTGVGDKPDTAYAKASAAPLPEGFKQAETSLLTLAVPAGWSAEADGKDLIFTVNGEKVGETETLDWFDAQSWMHLRPNHTEQKAFTEVTDIPSPAPESRDLRLYRIGLVHTKPAAQMDPDWQYAESRWYWTDSAAKLAYGVYFNETAVDEATMRKVVSSIRLKAGK